MPAREVLFTDDTQSAAEAAARAAAERINLPDQPAARDARRASARASPRFGMEALLPGLLRGRARHGASTTCRCWSREPLVYLDDPLGAGPRRRGALRARSSRSAAAAHARAGPGAPARGSTSPRDDVLTRGLARYPVVEGGGLSLSPRSAPVAFTLRHDRRICARPSSRHHGEEGALTPAGASGSQRWREMRVATRHRLRHARPGGPAQAAAAGPQRDGAGARRAASRTRRRCYDPRICAHLFTGEVSHGFVDAAGGLAVLATRRSSAPGRAGASSARSSSDQPFGAALPRPQGRRPHRPHRLRHRPLRGPDQDAGAGRARRLPGPRVRGAGTRSTCR